MGTTASQITSLTIVYSTVYLGADQRKHQSSASLAFMWGIPRWTVNSLHKWPVTWKMFPFDDVIMAQFCILSPVFQIIAGSKLFQRSFFKFVIITIHYCNDVGKKMKKWLFSPFSYMYVWIFLWRKIILSNFRCLEFCLANFIFSHRKICRASHAISSYVSDPRSPQCLFTREEGDTIWNSP